MGRRQGCWAARCSCNVSNRGDLATHPTPARLPCCRLHDKNVQEKFMGNMKSEGEDSLPGGLQICDSCNRVKRGDGNWFSLGKTYIPPSAKVSHGFCLDCCEKLSMSLPEIKNLLTDKKSADKRSPYVESFIIK